MLIRLPESLSSPGNIAYYPYLTLIQQLNTQGSRGRGHGTCNVRALHVPCIGMYVLEVPRRRRAVLVRRRRRAVP
jgi:hypothetical protein